MIKVAFQGEHGAYSEIACLKFFGKRVKTFPCKTLRGVFISVEDDKTDYGIVPIENSVTGDIYETYDLLLEFSLNIYGEEYVRIRHCLIAQKNTTLNNIKKVYSHFQALVQCDAFLSRMSVEEVVVYDTAGAVAMIKNHNRKDEAAIASELAARIYDMKLLKKNIESVKTNTTRFLVISKKAAKSLANMKTSIVFSTQHKPGALYHCLEGFAKNKVNLTKILSRPIKTGKWEYFFYLDFMGGLKDKTVKSSLEILKQHCYFVRILGSYPSADQRS